MHSYVALLRGINVGGHRPLPMADLRALLGTLKLHDVRTYLQSGNAVFKAAGTAKALQARIAKAIAQSFYDDVPVLLRSAAQIDDVITRNPYGAQARRDAKSVHAVFLSKAAQSEALEAVPHGKDAFVIVDDTLYMHSPDGYGNSKLTPAVIERVLGVVTTARNWQTVLKLQEMLHQA